MSGELESLDVPRQPEPRQLRAGNYLLMDSGITWLKPGGNGPTEVPLTNFAALIVADVARDDGAEVRRAYEIEARLSGRTSRFTVPAERFASMGWPAEHLGAEAIVRPGMGLRDHARVAIQELSAAQGIPARRVFTHTGWRQLPGGHGHGYLTASGAITASGLDESVSVNLGPALGGYDLPAPGTVGDVRAAIIASLAILDVAPDPVTVLLLGAAYRAPLPLPPDCSGWLYGHSGTFKTSLSALAQQHFGPALGAYQLPGNWTSTANMLELQAFTLDGVLFTVDDYSPDVSTLEARKRAATADRLLRGSANHTGRGRLNSDATMRPARPPRAQILTSAEDLPPAGASLRARVMVAEVPRGAVRLDPLTAAQEAADSGQLALAMAAYVQYLAARFGTLQPALWPRLNELRDAARAGGHARIAVNVASLALGWEQWLMFARAAGVVDDTAYCQLWRRAWKALCDLGADQDRYQRDADPASAYMRALDALVTSGRAHLASQSGGPPTEPERYGWRRNEMALTWQPQGQLMGWLAEDGSGLLLDPQVAYSSARTFLESAGTPLGVSRYALQQQLRDRHMLASTTGGRLTVQRRAGGRKREVLHVSAVSFYGE
ncbi:MAG: hypothetical protein ACLPKI_23070 [Streptosporangiaceae bacterium]